MVNECHLTFLIAKLMLFIYLAYNGWNNFGNNQYIIRAIINIYVVVIAK